MSARNQSFRLAVIGGGRMALAIGKIMGKRAAELRIHARRPETREELKKELPNVPIFDEADAALQDVDVVFLAVPATSLAEAAERYGDHARGDHIVLTACRGVGPRFALPHEMIRAKTCARKIGIFGGPLHVRELTTGRAIPAVLASRFSEAIHAVKVLTAGTPVKIHDSRDIIGVEVAGAISNVGALAAGMATSLEFGETARGVLLTHSLIEARRLGVALGAEEATFTGLAGIGDLIPRHVSSTDRHLVVGAKLAEGMSLEAALDAVGKKHVEGVITAQEASVKAKELGLDLPLINVVDQVARGVARPREALEAILHLDLDLETGRRVHG